MEPASAASLLGYFAVAAFGAGIITAIRAESWLPSWCLFIASGIFAQVSMLQIFEVVKLYVESGA